MAGPPVRADVHQLEVVERQVRLEQGAVLLPAAVRRLVPLQLPAALADGGPVPGPPRPDVRVARKGREAQVLVLLPIPVRREHGQAAEPLLAAAQRFLGPLSLGDVLHLRDEVHRPPPVVAYERAGQVPPQHAAVAVQVALFPVIRVDLPAQAPAALVQVLGHVVGMRDVAQGTRRQLGLRVTEHRAEGPVHAQPPRIGRDQRHPDGCVLEGAAEFLRAHLRLRRQRRNRLCRQGRGTADEIEGSLCHGLRRRGKD